MTRILTLALMAAMVLSLGSCRKKTETPPSAAQTTIGFSQVGAESNWRRAETESVVSEARKRNLDLKFSDAQGKQENQIQALRSFIGQRVKGIILAPIVNSGWDLVLRDAKAAGIPVVLVDRGIEVADKSLYATLIASDFVAEGRMAGEWLLKAKNGQCNIAELQGTPGADPAIDRKKGFEEAIRAHLGMKIIKSQTGNFELAGGKKAMEAFLKAEGKNIQAVYAHNDDMALGAVQAIEEAGMVPGRDMLVIAIDGGKPAFQAMAQGKINCIVECNPLLGPAAFDAMEAILAGEPVPKRTIIKDEIFTDQAGAKQIAETRKY